MGQGDDKRVWVCPDCQEGFDTYPKRNTHTCKKTKPSLLSGDAAIAAAKQMKEDLSKHAFSSGATSSEQKPAYHLIPSEAIKMLAQRFALGKIRHGDVNYQKCITEDENGALTLDLEFARDRFDHGLEHLLHLKATGNHRDDNIGAVLWFCALAAWVETKGFDWNRILTPKHVNEVQMMIFPQKDRIVVKDKQGTVFVEYLNDNNSNNT